eukprot:scaffold193981_cov20-Tisochrysis_lutea.AAC.1
MAGGLGSSSAWVGRGGATTAVHPYLSGLVTSSRVSIVAAWAVTAARQAQISHIFMFPDFLGAFALLKIPCCMVDMSSSSQTGRADP